MTVIYVFLIFSIYTIIKTISYGIYCIKTTGILSAVSAFALVAGIMLTCVWIFGNAMVI